jgi:hypothetical protein
MLELLAGLHWVEVIIIFTSLSFLQDNEGDETLKTTVNLKSVNGNEQFYEKIGATKKEKEAYPAW